MGLIRHLKLAQENLVKYELQYRSPLQGENIAMPTSPVSTNIGIYEALEDVGDADDHMRYIYENVPHHQDQIPSPELLRNNSTWNTVLFTSDNSRGTSQTRLSTIMEHSPEETVREPKEKGKRRIMDEFTSPPSSPRVLNVGYGTPFKSSSQFFIRPGGIPLPPPETLNQQNVIVGLGLPHTPAFESISSAREARLPQRTNPQPQSRPSNPFEGRQLPPHMSQAPQDEDIYVPTSASHRASDPSRDRHDHEQMLDNKRSDGGSSQHRQPPNDNSHGNGNRGLSGHPGGSPDGGDDDDDGDGNPHRGNNSCDWDSCNNCPPPGNPRGGGGGGGGGNPGSGGRNGPSRGGYQANNPNQGNIPYGNLVATIWNKLKQDQLPVWDGNKDTAIEYFWKIQQLAALEGDIPVALGYWLWKSLKENSRIWMWFTMLPFTEQSKMRTHYLHYLKGIKDNYLG